MKVKNKVFSKITGNYEQWLIESLKDKKEAAIFLQVALEQFQGDGDKESLLLSLRHVAEAQGGISRLAKKSKLNRESLYRTLSSKGNPKLETLGILLKVLGFKLSIEPQQKMAS